MKDLLDTFLERASQSNTKEEIENLFQRSYDTAKRKIDELSDLYWSVLEPLNTASSGVSPLRTAPGSREAP